MTARLQLVTQVAREVLGCRAAGVTRVGIDGVDGAGKTTFADELAETLRQLSVRQVIRASVDDFHHPRAIRYRRGRDSPEGFFLDSFDYDALLGHLLEPVGPDGSRYFCRRAFDLDADRPVEAQPEYASRDAVLIVDGIFLHRRELCAIWDYSVFLDVPFAVSVPRGAGRGEGWGSPDVDAPSNRRYIGGQQRYLDRCRPAERATRVIDNADLAAPAFVQRLHEATDP